MKQQAENIIEPQQVDHQRWEVLPEDHVALYGLLSGVEIELLSHKGKITFLFNPYRTPRANTQDETRKMLIEKWNNGCRMMPRDWRKIRESELEKQAKLDTEKKGK